jgi:hypothetical protein
MEAAGSARKREHRDNSRVWRPATQTRSKAEGMRDSGLVWRRRHTRASGSSSSARRRRSADWQGGRAGTRFVARKGGGGGGAGEEQDTDDMEEEQGGAVVWSRSPAALTRALQTKERERRRKT